MINELYELSRSLEHHGLLRATTHPEIGTVGKGECGVFELGEDGLPLCVRSLREEQKAALWRHSKGNHNSFPAIRLHSPLLSAGESGKIAEKDWKRAKLHEKIAMLSDLDYTAVNPACKDLIISDWTLQKLRPVLDTEQPELMALKQLISVFPRGEDERVAFLREAVSLVKKEVMSCRQDTWIDWLKKLLVGTKNPKSGRYTAGCMTYFDLYAMGRYENLVASAETRDALIQLLNSCDRPVSPREGAAGVVSPLSGLAAEGVGEKYPNPNLPLLGLTYLYSKKSDIPCLTRYTLTGTEGFQAGKAEVSAIHDALAFLTEEGQKNKTWRAMGGCSRDKPGLLLAYLPDEPQNDALLAKVLGDPSDYEDLEEYSGAAQEDYGALCQQVTGGLEHVLRKNPSSIVRLILLESLDPGHKQIAYESSFTAERLNQNMRAWDNASKNAPPIGIRFWDKKEIHVMGPVCPGPYGICQMFKGFCTQSGTLKTMSQSAVSLHEIYALYMPVLDSDRTGLVDHFLDLAVSRSRLMLGYIGCRLTAGYALPSGRQSKTLAKQAAGFVSLLSMLLCFKQIRKGDFMLDAPFNVGQFLKLSDMLHKEYCVQVRNGGDKRGPIPSQLMGNEFLVVVSEHPAEGLVRLRDRMKVYKAWADTAVGENAGRAKWILARYGEVCRKIAEHELPEEYGSTEQAQVLLGYLADIPYEKKKALDSQSGDREVQNRETEKGGACDA